MCNQLTRGDEDDDQHEDQRCLHRHLSLAISIPTLFPKSAVFTVYYPPFGACGCMPQESSSAVQHPPSCMPSSAPYPSMHGHMLKVIYNIILLNVSEMHGFLVCLPAGSSC
jgi:hypothetical protein